MKLALFDRTAALLPLHGDRPSAGSLVVHSPALIEVCVALFEGIWERATPVSLESRQDWPARAASVRRSRPTNGPGRSSTSWPRG